MSEIYTPQPKLKHVPHLEIMDVDKTLIITRKIQRVLEAEAELHGVDTDAMRWRRQRTPMFDTVKDLREQAGVSEAQLEDIHASFLSAIGRIGVENFLYPGAREYLEVREAENEPLLLLTTGGGEWQRPWKLRATELIHYPNHVTGGRRKSLLLVRGFNPATGLYEFGEVESLPDADGFAFETFSITDDNEQAMIGIPEGARGYLMAHDEVAHRRNLSLDLPPNVTPVFGFEHLYEETQAA